MNIVNTTPWVLLLSIMADILVAVSGWMWQHSVKEYRRGRSGLMARILGELWSLCSSSEQETEIFLVFTDLLLSKL